MEDQPVAGIRNIPSSNSLASLCLFSRRNEFLCAGVRKYIFVFDVKNGNLVKTLDAHFARVCGLMSVTAPDRTNKLISSSLDKTIKVSKLEFLITKLFCRPNINSSLSLRHKQICGSQAIKGNPNPIEFFSSNKPGEVSS